MTDQHVAQMPLQFPDVMLDLETMGTGPLAPIVAIGAVLFDPINGIVGEGFYAATDLQSAVAIGAVIDPGTVLWWLRQSDAARAAIAQDGATPITVALLRFADWMHLHTDERNVRVWGNGASFDNVILAQAYRMAGQQAPWRYYNDRCYRTMKAQQPDLQLVRSGTHHNALDDAESQARHLVAIFGNSTAVQA